MGWAVWWGWWTRAGTWHAYGYDPYGQTVTKTGNAADGNPFRHTGTYLDATKPYKMGARYCGRCGAIAN